MAITSSHALTAQRRLVAAQSIPPEQATTQILAQQRLHRPVSPHLGIYRPQITWVPSMFNRLTGIVMSGAFYLYGLTYLAAPALGWHVETAALAASFGAWPAALKLAVKAVVAWPFTFHALNGLRHLAWDTASMITNAQVARTGWMVVGLSAVSALGLAVM